MKKIITLALALFMLAQVPVSAAFSDMPQDAEIATAITNAVNNGLLSGYEDGTVRPDANIRRSEMAVIITNACRVVNEGDISSFVDVKSGDWFYSPIAKAYEMGAFAGGGNYMHPNNNITFQECFTVLSQVFDLLPAYKWPVYSQEALPENTLLSGLRLYDISALANFSDASEVADWAKIYVCGVVANGGWNGVDGKLTPNAYITRGQFAVVMNNLIQNYIDQPGTYTELPAGNTMIRCDGVVLNNVVTDYDLYIGDSVSPLGITINNIRVNKRFVVRGCATPVPSDKEGNKTYGEEGIFLSGHVESLRIIRPYINLNMLNATANQRYSVPDTMVTFRAYLN